MIEYYILKPSLNLSELGTYTQVDTICGEYRPEDRELISSRMDNEMLPSHVRTPELKLYREAKYSDLVHSAIPGFDFLAVSIRALEVLQKMELDKHQIFRTTLYKIKEARDYAQLYFYNQRPEFIDWDRSELVNWQAKGHVERGDISIRTYQDYLEEVKRRYADPDVKYSLRMKKLVLKREEIDLDLFKLTNPALGYYVSHKFMSAVLEAGLTGFAFESIELLNKRRAAVKPWPGYESA